MEIPSISELVEGDRGGEVLEAVLAEVLQLDRAGLEQRDGGGGEDDLAAVGGAHDPCGAVDVEADVLGRVERGLAGVDPDPDPDRAAVEPAHRLG